MSVSCEGSVLGLGIQEFRCWGRLGTLGLYTKTSDSCVIEKRQVVAVT